MSRHHLLQLLGLSFITLLMGSCGSTKTIPYFQDLGVGDSVRFVKPHVITFQPGDKFSIIVSSKEPKLAALFNLPIATYQAGQSPAGTSSYNQITMYTVNTDGCIDFPILGKVKVTGLTRQETAALIKGMLIGKDLLKDPVVTIDYGTMNFSVLGEVSRPGQYSIDHDQVTLLDALSKAGDLTIYGRRDSVKVLREVDGKQKAYSVNLTSWKDLTSSPAYYVKQNDVIYVTPNDTRSRQSTVNGNNVRSTSFWISLASLFTSIAVLLK